MINQLIVKMKWNHQSKKEREKREKKNIGDNQKQDDYWRRKRQPTPVFLPGESQGRQGLVGCRLWGHTESDTTEAT